MLSYRYRMDFEHSKVDHYNECIEFECMMIGMRYIIVYEKRF